MTHEWGVTVADILEVGILKRFHLTNIPAVSTIMSRPVLTMELSTTRCAGVQEREGRVIHQWILENWEGLSLPADCSGAIVS